MFYKIDIAAPCAEDWSNMVPVENGKHCAQCAQSVIDFTNWRVEEISAYLYAKKNESVCGRFREEQLQDNYPEPATFIFRLHHSGLSLARKIAALILFVFCLSTSVNAQQTRHLTGDTILAIQGKPAPYTVAQQTMQQKNNNQKDPKRITPKNEDHAVMGLIAMPVKKDKVKAKIIKGRMAPAKKTR